MNSINSVSSIIRCFTVTVHGLVYAFGSSTVIDVTVDDPKAYTRPWTVRLNQHIMVDNEMLEFICNENNRDPQHMIGK